jgi:hypothetical protein
VVCGKVVGWWFVATDDHFARVADRLVRGRVVPFLGAGANLCDRPEGAAWEPGLFVPSGAELARALAEQSRYPDPGDPDLTWVAQYLVSVMGEMELYRLLHSVFDAGYQPTSLHRLLARLPAILREQGQRQLLVLTTNYDVLVERAFDEVGEQYDVVWYEAKARGPDQGIFMHRRPEGDVVPVKRPYKYTGIPIDLERPVVVKLHGSVDRDDYQNDSYVLDEDSYIRYLTGPGLAELVPVPLLEAIAESHLLFLGYSMRDWNIRAMLGERRRVALRSWAVQLQPPSEATRVITREIWRRFGEVDVLDMPLSDYVSRLAAELDAVVLSERS